MLSFQFGREKWTTHYDFLLLELLDFAWFEFSLFFVDKTDISWLKSPA